MWLGGLGWVAAAWTFLLVGADDIGWSAPYAAWSEGFASFPRWLQKAFAVVGTPTLILSIIATGAAVSVGGTAALWRVAKHVAATVVATSIVLTLAMWLWPNGQYVLS